ncbi:hypothetical protein ACIQM3_08415 [Streptomyces sp. NPDC091271]|uniref:hypothetical protein n=1 Tax=Streptomyces sp. NPDC091271 TaxID=3365980 RepID=UPI00382B3ADF
MDERYGDRAGDDDAHERVHSAAGSEWNAASACTRFGVLAAGIASADDPVHTVGPQREAAEQRSQRSQ